MSDIIERSLQLSVVGVDEASEIFAAIADQVDDLQERVQTGFAAMSGYAEDSASTIAEAAQSWAPVWISQLEALESAAAGTFTGVGEQAAAGAKAAGESASGMTSAWVFQLDEISGAAAGAAGEVTDVFASTAEDPGANGETIASAWLGNLEKIDEAAATTAESVTGELAGISADANGDGLASLWASNLDKITEDAAAAAEDITAALESPAADANGEGLAAQWATNLDKIDADATATAAAVEESLGGVAATANGDGLVTEWSTNLDKIAADAEAAAGKVDEAFSPDDAAAAEQAGKFAVAWEAAWSTMAEDAKVVAGEIDEAFGLSAATAAEETSAAGSVVAGKGAGEKGAATSGEAATTSSEGSFLDSLGLGSLLSKTILPLIGVGIGVGGAEQSSQSLIGLSNFADQLGTSVTKAWQTELATSYMGGNSRLETMLGHLESQIGNIETAKPGLQEGVQENLGLGREAIEPSSVRQALSATGLKGAAEGFALLFGSPQTAAAEMQNMQPREQLGLIATKLDDIKNANERVQITNDIFGMRGGVNMLPLIENYQGAMGAAGKYIEGTGAGTAKQLEEMAGTPGGKSTLEQFSMTTSGMETAIEVGLAKLDPTLTLLEKATISLVNWLEGHGGAVSSAVHTAVTGFEHPLRVNQMPSPSSSFWDPESERLFKDVTGGLGHAASWIGHEASGLLGDIGIGPGTSAASAAETSAARSTTSALARLGVTSSAQGSSMDAIVAAAEKYGINPEAMLASSYAESTLVPTSHQGGGGEGRGLFQFSPGTFTSDYESLYHKAPTGDASTYSASIQAMVAAHEMAQSGVGRSGNVQSAFTDIVQRFEKPSGDPAVPGSKGGGYAGDLSRGGTFIDTMTPQLDKMDEATQKHMTSIHANVDKGMHDTKTSIDTIAPELPPKFAEALNLLIDDVEKYGGQIPTKLKTHLDTARGYVEEEKPKLNTAGKDALEGLLEGLESEAPALDREAQSIAQGIENTIRAALDSHSPSEVMARVGDDIIAGLTIGMHRSAAGAHAAAHGVASSIAGGAAGAGGASGQALQITIPVMIDGREVGQAVCEYQNNQLKLMGPIPSRI